MKRHVQMLAGCDYQRIDDEGLHLTVNGEPRVLAVDNIVICAGQEPLQELMPSLEMPCQLVGGANIAAELDAKRAINEATRAALKV
jgi:2,4-dienoyl-CoA reductase (NADPH2)